MKLINSFGLVWLAALSATAHAQVYSQNIVGYANVELFAGNNLIASQFSDADNTLNTIFQTGIPEGATFTEWDPTGQQYLPASVYDTSAGWSINYTLGYGEGGLFNTPSAFINTYVGSVWPGFTLPGTFVPPVVSTTGTQLLACVIPINEATFYDVVGRDPENGESVTWLDGSTQATTTSTYDNGAWDNGAPSLDIGESAFFNLLSGASPDVSVPEPDAGVLTGIGLLGLAMVRGWKRRS